MMYSQQIDTKHLKLNLTLDWKKKQAIGYAELTLNLNQTSDKIILDAGDLTIQSIYMNGQILNFNYTDKNALKNLEINLDRSYSPSEELIIKINYNSNHENKADPNAIWGSFGRGLRFQAPTSLTPLKRKQVWNSGESNNNRYWFPCNEDISDIHTTEFYLTVEHPFMAICNGQLIETIDNGNHTKTFHYLTDNAFPNYLISIVIGEYEAVIQNYKHFKIQNFGYPHELEAIKATTEPLPKMMQFFEQKLKSNYPFSTYTQVVVQDYPFPGLVGQHMNSILSDNYIDDHGVHEDFKYLWDGVAVQALANQWFGNLIMPKSWDDSWLNSAFAQYFAGIYTSESNSKTEYLTWYYPFEKGAAIGSSSHPIVWNTANVMETVASDNCPKYKGALVLRMLQYELGDSTWWKAIQYYVQKNQHKQVQTKDFQHAIEFISGKSYQWFFDQWIYNIGLPKFEFKKNYNPSSKKLELTVLQVQKKDSQRIYEETAYFQGTIKIEIDNEILSFHLKPEKENKYELNRDVEPLFVNFNFESIILSESNYTQSNEELLQMLTSSKDVIAKQKSIDKLVEIAIDSNTTPGLKLKIKQAISHEINSKYYWRYRQYALVSLRKISSFPYGKEFTSLVINLIKNESSWLKASAILTLGNSKDPKYLDIYTHALNDKSDRVINAAATAIGKTKSPKALKILLDLDKKPSWKNQSRISAMNGLEQLGDVNAVDYILKCLTDNQSARWYLATPTWDYPYAASNTLVTLGKADLGFLPLMDQFKKSILENDINDIFQLVQLIDILKDERAGEMYSLLKSKFKKDKAMMEIIQNYEIQYLERIKK